jgi:acyl carrier protein
MSVEAKIKEVIVDLLGVDESEIQMDTDLREDLGADSLDFTEIVMELEEEYGFEADEAKLLEIKTFGDVVKYIEEAK